MVYIVGEGGPNDPHRQPLATKKGTPIPNTRRLPQPPAAMAARAEAVRKGHPTAELRSLSSEYNCVGMALASRRAFVDIEHLTLILEEDGYRRVSDRDVVAGDLAV